MAQLTKEQLEQMSLEEVNAFNTAQISGASITGSDLTTPKPFNVTQPEPTPIPDIFKIDTALQDTATKSAPAETNVSDLIKRITDTQSSILGESAFTAEQQKAQGISDLTSKQNDLVAQIQSFQTQSQALENQKTLVEERIMQESEGRGRTAGGISPLIASAQRRITLQQADIASQALIAQANLYGTQGKLATANMLVEQAVNAKFGAKKEQLKADMANLDILLKDPALDKAIKDRAAAQLLIKQKQDTELKKQTDNFEEAQKETLKYSGIADSVTLAKMSKAKTALEVAQIAQAAGLKTLEQQKAEKELATFGETGDIGEYQKAIRLGLIPKGTSFFEYVRQKGAAGRKGDSEGEPTISSYQQRKALETISSVNSLITEAKNNSGIFGRTAALPMPDFLRSGTFRNFRAELDTLKSNIAFSELVAMREASKTGGALGQVSDREGKLLESSLGALDMTQTPENFVKQLEKIRDSIQRWQDAVSAAGGQAIQFNQAGEAGLNPDDPLGIKSLLFGEQ